MQWYYVTRNGTMSHAMTRRKCLANARVVPPTLLSASVTTMSGVPVNFLIVLHMLSAMSGLVMLYRPILVIRGLGSPACLLGNKLAMSLARGTISAGGVSGTNLVRRAVLSRKQSSGNILRILLVLIFCESVG